MYVVELDQAQVAVIEFYDFRSSKHFANKEDKSNFFMNACKMHNVHKKK